MNSDVSIGQSGRQIGLQQVPGKSHKSASERLFPSEKFSDLLEQQDGKKTDDGSKVVPGYLKQSEQSRDEKPSGVKEGEDNLASAWSEAGQGLPATTELSKGHGTGASQPVLMSNVQYSLPLEAPETNLEEETPTAIVDGTDLVPVEVAVLRDIDSRRDVSGSIDAGDPATLKRASGQPIDGKFVKVGVAVLAGGLAGSQALPDGDGNDAREKQSGNNGQATNIRRPERGRLQGLEIETSIEKQKYLVTAGVGLKAQQARVSNLKQEQTDRTALFRQANEMRVQVLGSSLERHFLHQNTNVVWDQIGLGVLNSLEDGDGRGWALVSGAMGQATPFASKTKTVRYLNIQLKPENLGTISIKLILSNDDLNISLTGSDPDLIERLKQDSNRLAKQIRAAGFSFEKLNIAIADMDNPSSMRIPLPNAGLEGTQSGGRFGNDSGQQGEGWFRENSEANDLRAPERNEGEDERKDDGYAVNVRKGAGADIYL